MEIHDTKNNEKILEEAERIVNEIMQNKNWIPLTDLLISQLAQGYNAPKGIGKVIKAGINDKEIIAKTRDSLLKHRILAIKFEGMVYEVYEAGGEINGFMHSSCSAEMNFDPGIIARQDLGISTLGHQQIGFNSLEIAIKFADAYRASIKKYFGYKPNLKICEIKVAKEL